LKAAAGVSDHEDQLGLLHVVLNADANVTAGCVLNGVENQVAQNLLESRRVTNYVCGKLKVSGGVLCYLEKRVVVDILLHLGQVLLELLVLDDLSEVMLMLSLSLKDWLKNYVEVDDFGLEKHHSHHFV